MGVAALRWGIQKQELQSASSKACGFRRHRRPAKEPSLALTHVLHHDTVRSLLSCLCAEVHEGESEWENKEQDPGSHAVLGRGPDTRDAWPPNTCTHAGTSMILGILFYLMQAREYLQEGMTYKLGCSFYLAWTGVFFFVMIGRGQGRVGVWGLGMDSRMQMGTGVG